MSGLSLVDAIRLVRSGTALQLTDALFTDAVLTDLINEAASIAESELRPPWRQAIAVLTVASGALEMPADWAETKQVFSDPTRAYGELDEVSVTDLLNYGSAGDSGVPRYWCQEDDRITLRPTPTDGEELTVVYYRVPPELVDSGDVTLMPRDLAILSIVPKACELVHLRQGDRVMADAKATAYLQSLSRLRRRARGSTRPARVRVRPGGWV